MNTTRIALIIMILAAAIGLYFAGKKVGFSDAVAQNNSEVAKVTQQALIEQRRLQKITQDQAYVFNKSIEAERSAHENTKNSIKQKPTVQNCIRNNDGSSSAFITSGTIRVLASSINSKALPTAGNSVGVAGEKNTATANDLSTYSGYSITEYNMCAIQLNSLINIVSKL